MHFYTAGRLVFAAIPTQCTSILQGVIPTQCTSILQGVLFVLQYRHSTLLYCRGSCLCCNTHTVHFYTAGRLAFAAIPTQCTSILQGVIPTQCTSILQGVLFVLQYRHSTLLYCRGSCLCCNTHTVHFYTAGGNTHIVHFYTAGGPVCAAIQAQCTSILQGVLFVLQYPHSALLYCRGSCLCCNTHTVHFCTAGGPVCAAIQAQYTSILQGVIPTQCTSILQGVLFVLQYRHSTLLYCRG